MRHGKPFTSPPCRRLGTKSSPASSQPFTKYRVTFTLEGFSISDIEQVVALANTAVREASDTGPILSRRDQHGSRTEVTVALAAPDPVAAVAIATRILHRAMVGLSTATLVGIEAEPVS